MKPIDLFYGLDKMTMEDVKIIALTEKKSLIKKVVKHYHSEGFKQVMHFNPQLKEMKLRIGMKIKLLSESI